MKRTAVYVGLVSCGAVAVTVLLHSLAPTSTPEELRAALYMSVVGVVAHIMLYRLPRGAAGSVAFIPFLAGALVAPCWPTVAGVAASMLLTEAFLRRRSPIKALFNAAQASLAVGIAILAFIATRGSSLLNLRSVSLADGALHNLIPTIALIAVFFSTNSALVSGVIAITTGSNVLHVWRKNTLSTVPYDVLSSPVVYLFGWVYAASGPFGATALCIPLLGVRQLYRTNSQLEQVNRELLELMVKAIEARDPYTSGHSRRVAHYSRLIARAVGLNPQEVDRIGIAALLHDVGKIHEEYAPILRKPDKLTADEWAIMQTHPIRSAELVSTVSHLRDVVAPVRHHHENWDGTGYPDGLAGEAIPLGARIVLFADTIDAMTTDRPYRKALGEAQVRAELVKYRGKQFDPQICDKLLASPMFGLLFSPSGHESTPTRVKTADQDRMAVVGA